MKIKSTKKIPLSMSQQKRKTKVTSSEPQNKISRRRIVITFLILASIGIIIFWTPISNYWIISTADQGMVSLAQQANMSTEGEVKFLQMNPELVSNSEMASLCSISKSTVTEGFVEQGCYIPSSNEPEKGKIYIREMPTELKSMEVVTAAHELLHPVYFELLKSMDASTLNTVLENNFTANISENLNSRMATYAQIEPEYRSHELFSILGTEYGNVSTDLMAYYSPYFNDSLGSVVAANTKTYSVFEANISKLKAIKDEIQNLSDLAAKQLESADYAYYCSTTWARVGNAYENTRNYNIYVQLLNSYKSYITQQNSKVDEYNSLLDQANTLLAQFNGTQPLEPIQNVQPQTEN
jgi:hypothetical protein